MPAVRCPLVRGQLWPEQRQGSSPGGGWLVVSLGHSNSTLPAHGVPKCRARHGMFPAVVRGHRGSPQPSTPGEVPPEMPLLQCHGVSLAQCHWFVPSAIPLGCL